jgi:eight-cysteine-cluster-containing protein
MNTYVLHKIVGAGLAAATLLVGCAVDSSDPPMGSMSIDMHAMRVQEGCPDGWMGTDHLKVYCPNGMVLVSKTFGETTCVQCAEADVPEPPALCDGEWRDARLMFGCAPGFVLEYSPGHECKRCVEAAANGSASDGDAAECHSDDDCFRTGCSGEICAAESAASLCIWRPEHECYEDRFCGCQQGSCGFKDHPQLLTCIEDATGDN